MSGSQKQMPAITPETPLTTLNGIGPERAAQLARLGCHTVGDLLFHRPRRYEDRRRFRAIRDLQPGESAIVRGQIVACGVKYWHKRTRSVFELIVDDGTARLHCRWWNMPYMQEYFATGDQVMVFGRPVSLKPFTMDHPETEVLQDGDEDLIHLNRIVPVYPLTEGLPQRWLRAFIFRLLENPLLRLPATPPVASEFPAHEQAVRWLHFPAVEDETVMARQRLALEEYFEFQLAIQGRRQRFNQQADGLPCGGNNHAIKPWLARLGFHLTEAQTRALRQIRQDMSGAHPMRRLLQGDVGSGKTVVAGGAMLMALESGFNAALMAPTEILADQHYRTFKRWFDPLGVPVVIQTGGRKELEECPAGGPPKVIIGTHALIESDLSMDPLGLVVIDEQHKFGVAQRERLVRKGRFPHLLVMTATPIPRTLGLTLYGDLDLTIIDQMPEGRGRVRTFVRTTDSLPKVWDFVRQQIADGRQTYVVYPLIEESETSTLKAVKKEFASIREQLASIEVGLLHGRLRAEEKDAVMAAFRSGTIQVLVATTVIEVGVDVPNATVMVIENADRFGLAQLHQLRGRIGRGSHTSYCVLVADASTPEAAERLKVLEQTHDGFKIAEADLAMRGPGEFLGRDQSGMPPFRFGDLAGDAALVARARVLAAKALGV